MSIFPVQTIKTEKGYKKVPALNKGQSWQTYDGDYKEIEGSKNYGVVVPEGILIIDLDLHKGVNKGYIEKELGCPLQWQLLQKTISGGEHYAFRVPQGVELKQGSNLFGLAGFDTRCSGRGWLCTGEGYERELDIEIALDVEDWPELPKKALDKLGRSAPSVDSDDLMALVVNEPLDITRKECIEHVKNLSVFRADDYDDWLRVGMGLHHQSQGSEWGLKVWRAFSKKSDKFAGDADLIKRWSSFNGKSNNITFASVIKMSKADLEKKTLEEIKEGKESVLKVRGLAELVSDRTCLRWLIKDFIPREKLIMVHGKSAAGKSYCVIDMCLSIATGCDNWAGKRCKKGKVFYIAGEGRDGLTRRLQAWAQHNDWNGEGAENFLTNGRGGALLDTKEGLELIRHELTLAEFKPDLIVIDTVNKLFGGDENSARDVGAFVRNCEALRDEFGCAIVLVHHTGHGDGTQDRARGSSAWRAALDMEVSVTKKDGRLCVSSMKDKEGDGSGENGGGTWFEFKRVNLGYHDEDEEEQCSSVIVETQRTGSIDLSAHSKKDAKKLVDYKKQIKDFIEDCAEIEHGAYVFTSGQLKKWLFECGPATTDNSAKQMVKPKGGGLVNVLIDSGVITSIGKDHNMTKYALVDETLHQEILQFDFDDVQKAT